MKRSSCSYYVVSIALHSGISFTGPMPATSAVTPSSAESSPATSKLRGEGKCVSSVFLTDPSCGGSISSA